MHVWYGQLQPCSEAVLVLYATCSCRTVMDSTSEMDVISNSHPTVRIVYPALIINADSPLGVEYFVSSRQTALFRATACSIK